MTDVRSDPPLHTLGADALARGYAAGHFTPSDVAEALLGWIERCEPRLHALFHHDPAAVRAAAAASTRRRAEGRPLSPLDGVPGTLKENIATPEAPLPIGTAASELRPAGWEAPPAARWREAGLVLLGKTTMPDWGMLTSGLSSLHASACNPWNDRLTPGGSSAGAGAAGAAGYGPLHLGTDIGGSIRLPAGWCGLVGLKPSGGRLPILPPYAGRVAGPMTRSVRDAAWMMALLARPDPAQRDTTALPAAELDWLGGTEPPRPTSASRPLAGLRLGWLRDAGWGLPVEPGVAAVVEQGVRRLADAGAEVVEIPPFLTATMVDGMDRFWRMRSFLDLQALAPAARERVLPYIRAWAEGAAGYDGAAVFTGFSQIGALREAAVAATRGFDFLVSPTCPVGPPPADWASPTNDPGRPFEHIGFTLPFNMSEQPAISVPAGMARTRHGGESLLPVGLQIAGHRHDDVGVLRLAAVFETLRAALPAWPEGLDNTTEVGQRPT